MKILIAYGGSEFTDSALIDLSRAGLPETLMFWFCPQLMFL